MRVLLGCSIGGAGHLLPVVSAAQALERLGHEPILLVAPSLTARAADSGLEVIAGEQPSPRVVQGIWERMAAGPREHVRFLIDRELFAERGTDAMLARATAVCRERTPELIVREPCEYATAIVAHRAGIPQAQVGISQSRIEHAVLAHVAGVLEQRAPGVADRIAAAPYLSPFPASLDPSPWSDTRRFRQPTPDAAPLPDWWPGRSGQPLVYVTFGSVLGGLPAAREAYRTVLDAVDGLPVRVLLTIGSAFDRGSLGPLPANVRVEPWVAQHDVLAAAELVVCHGGSGTVLGALSAGVPMVLCPLFADQGANASLLVRAGAAVPLTSGPDGGVRTLTGEAGPELRQAIVSLLADAGRHRQAARALADELGRSPSLDDVFAGLLAR